MPICQQISIYLQIQYFLAYLPNLGYNIINIRVFININNLGGNIMGDKNPKPKSEDKKKPKTDKIKKEKKKYE